MKVGKKRFFSATFLLLTKTAMIEDESDQVSIHSL